MERELRKESVFSKIETQKGDILFVLISFEEQKQMEKKEFELGSIVIFKSTLPNYVLTTKCKNNDAKITLHFLVVSTNCLNEALEWNYAYFKKIRLCFQRVFRDVTYIFNQDGDSDEAKVNLFFLSS